MPLITDDIFEAREAYSAMEYRALAAEQNASVLRVTVDNLTSAQQLIKQNADLLTGFAARQIGANTTLATQLKAQVVQTPPDVTLDKFIGALGLAVAMAEASMADRVTNTVSVTVPAYLTFTNQPDGSTTTGLRLYQPEFGSPGALATISFELAKVAVEPNLPAPRSLYLVLQDKQAQFSDPFWIQFSNGSPPASPAGQIIAEISKIFTACGQWTFPFLVQEASTIANLESALSNLVGKAAPPVPTSAYRSAVGALCQLTGALSSRTDFVAGDLFALASALDLTTQISSTLRM